MAQMMSFQLKERLESIVAPGDMNGVAFRLIEWAKTHGREKELIAKAHQERPTNPMLRAFVAEHLPSVLVEAPAWSVPQLPLQGSPTPDAAPGTLTAADERGTRATVGTRLQSNTIFRAFQQQVRREIERRVGRKYLPELFQPRPIENDIRVFIESDLDKSQLEELKSEVRHIVVPKLPDGVDEEWASALQALAEAAGWAEVESVLERLNSVADEPTKSVLQELAARTRSFRRSTFLIKDRAGSGKTTLLCHAALHHSVGVVTMFLSCKFDLPRSGSLKEVIAAAIRTEFEAQLALGDNEYALPADSDRLIREVAAAIKDAGRQLIIFLDGINENDYVMAVNYVRKHMWDQKNVGEITLDILDLLEKSQRFEQARGIIEYLVLLSESKGMHRVQCAALARLGSHEILCNLLPKLRENTDWAIEILRWCLFACDKLASASGKGNADHSLARTAELIRNSDQEKLYDNLLAIAPIQISRQVEPQERGDTETKEPVLVLDDWLRMVVKNSFLQPSVFMTDEKAGEAGHWQLHNYLWGLRQLDITYLHSSDNLANNAIDAAARCIRSLFSSEREKAWEVIKAWALEGGILALTSNYLIGMDELYTAMFSEAETYQQLGLWLLSDDERDQEAAARLLSQFSVAHLSTATADWSETTVTKASSTISRAFGQVFMREPDHTLKVLVGWSKEGTGKYDDLIAQVLEQAYPPEGMSLDVYRRWEMQLISMKAGVRATHTSHAIYNFINRLRNVRSRANNKYAPGADKQKYFLNKRSKRR